MSEATQPGIFTTNIPTRKTPDAETVLGVFLEAASLFLTQESRWLLHYTIPNHTEIHYENKKSARNSPSP